VRLRLLVYGIEIWRSAIHHTTPVSSAVGLHLRNPWFRPFRCPSAVGGQPISVRVTSSLCIRKDVPGSSISVLTCIGNGSYGTE